MNPQESSFNLRFVDIASNPHIRALHRSLEAIIPDAVWWITDPQVGRMPFPGSGLDHSCEEAERDDAAKQGYVELAERLQQGSPSDEPIICACCNGYLQGVASFFYRGLFVGGIGVCHVRDTRRETLREVLHLVRGYMELLGNYLEDNDDLELVHGMWTEMISVLDLSLLLERVSEELLRTIDRPRCAIVMVDEDGEFVPSHLSGYGIEADEARRVRLSRYDYATQIRRLSEGMNVLEQEDRFVSWFREVERESITPPGKFTECDGSVCLVPFVRNEMFVGALLFPGPPPELSHGRRRLLDLVAVGAATALDNAAIFLRMNQRQLALTTIHTVHRLMISCRNLDELLPRIGQLATQLMKVKKCSLMVATNGGHRMQARVRINLEPGEAGTQDVQCGQGLAGWVAENFNPVIYRPGKEALPDWIDDGLDYPDACYLCVPLIEEDVVGVLTVSKVQGRFTPGDREILMTYAEQSLIAIQNVQVHEGERDVTRRTLRSVANLLESRDPTTDGLICHTSDLAGRLANAMSLDADEIRDITYAALLANAGLLRRMGERGLRKTPTRSSEDLDFSRTLAGQLGLSPHVGEIVSHLGLNWNGHGNPDGLSGEEIPIGSRILTLTEAYVNLVEAHHSSRSPRDPYRAITILRRLAGRHYDPTILKDLESIVLTGEPQA